VSGFVLAASLDGFSDDGLPIGLHVMAKRFDETSIFRITHAYEQATPWHTMRPPDEG